ncbi:MAG: competence/damage-inducible protein A [Velocimicrobium sp.]
MVVELLSVGTEILMGNIVNTNASYLAKQCADLGIDCYTQVTVGDNEKRLEEAIQTAMNRADIVILTGGLGPTKDDLTKEISAKILEKELVRDKSWEDKIRSYFKDRQFREIAENNWKQADVIEGAILLENRNGTAPGEIVETENKASIILLPGPPNEMKPMFEESVYPYLKKRTDNVFVSKMVKLCGIGESSAEEKIMDLIDGQTNPTIAPYAKTCEVHIRVTANAKEEKEGEALLTPVIEELYHRFGTHIFTIDEGVTLEAHVVSLLNEKEMHIATAESLSGGQIAAALINVPGASAVLNESYITYSNEAKMRLLHVKEETLQLYGAVSEQTAYEMAIGAYEAADANVSIAVTGIAGPDGGSREKPVGLVYMGCCVNGTVMVEKYNFKGNRQTIRDCTVVSALDFVRRCIL